MYMHKRTDQSIAIHQGGYAPGVNKEIIVLKTITDQKFAFASFEKFERVSNTSK